MGIDVTLEFEHLTADAGIASSRLSGRVAVADAGDLPVAVRLETPSGKGTTFHAHRGRLVRPLLRADLAPASLADLDVRGPDVMRPGENPLRRGTGGSVADLAGDLDRRKAALEADMAAAVILDGVLMWPRPEPFFGVWATGRTLRVGVHTVEDRDGLLARFPIDGHAMRAFVEAYRRIGGAASITVGTGVVATTGEGHAWRMVDDDVVTTQTLRIAYKWLWPFAQRLAGRGASVAARLGQAVVDRSGPPNRVRRDASGLASLIREAATEIEACATERPPTSIRQDVATDGDLGRDAMQALVTAVASTFSGRRDPVVVDEPRAVIPPLEAFLRSCGVDGSEIRAAGSISGGRPGEASLSGLLASLPPVPAAAARLGFDGPYIQMRNVGPLVDGIARHHGIVTHGDDAVTILRLADVTAALWVGNDGTGRLTPFAATTEDDGRSLADLVAAGSDRLVAGPSDLIDDEGRAAFKAVLGDLWVLRTGEPTSARLVSDASGARGVFLGSLTPEDRVDDELKALSSILAVAAERHGTSFDEWQVVGDANPMFASSYRRIGGQRLWSPPARKPSATLRHLTVMGRSAARKRVMAFLRAGPETTTRREAIERAEALWANRPDAMASDEAVA